MDIMDISSRKRKRAANSDPVTGEIYDDPVSSTQKLITDVLQELHNISEKLLALEIRLRQDVITT
jgi:hypothetical protein